MSSTPNTIKKEHGNKGKRRSDIEKLKMSQTRKGKHMGEFCPSWRGGHTLHNGYFWIKLHPDDFFYPMTNKQRYVYEHRLVVAKALGRCLHPWEIVHHKHNKYPAGSTEDKQDNRYPENLSLELVNGHNQITILEQRVKRLEVENQSLSKRILLLEAERVLQNV